MNRRMTIGWVLVGVLVVALGWSQRVGIRGWLVERQYQEDLPPPVSFDEVRERSEEELKTHPPAGGSELKTDDRLDDELGITAEVNLAVPFAAQAPHGNWEQPYQDACEEATIIMVERYLAGTSLLLDEMDEEILEMVAFQEEEWGFYKDSNVAETARLVEAFYPHLQARTVYDVTAADIIGELAQGNPVVVLVDGRVLGNPFYTAPGPDKHTLVIKGVVEGKFITNDPGTRRGGDFVYPIETVLGAMVDYDGDTPGTGTRAMVVIERKT